MVTKFSALVILSFITFTSVVQAQEAASIAQLTGEVKLEPPPPQFGPTKYKLHVDTLIMGQSTRDALSKSNAGLTDIAPRLDVIYNSWLSFDFQLEAFFVAGNGESFYTDEGKSSNGIYLDEAAVNLEPLPDLVFRGGALYTSLNPLLSIMSQNSFLGASQKYELKTAKSAFKVSAVADESVPSSGTVNKGLIDDAPNAYFLTQTLRADLVAASMATTFSVASTHYEFGNLSSNVASDSVLIGNNPSSFEGTKTNTQYLIGFEGFETAASVLTDWSKRITTELIGSYIQNNQAFNATAGTGDQAQLKVTTKFERFNIIPSYTLFHMGADVTPATYTITPVRYQDRDGFTAMLKFELKKEKISFFGSYTNGTLIQPNPYLADREIYALGVEGKYDIL